ncbi:MAG TPA: flagellar export protein FliJ [Tepidisphaeraceae bacterium]|jgi:flagellar export protein FliJ
MAQFTFELDGVLRQRKNVEQLAQRQAAIAQRTLTELQDQLRRLDESVKGVTADVRDNHLTGPINVSFITAHRRYIVNMERAVLDLARQIADAQQKVNQAQAILLEAAKQRKGIEKLRERQLERWTASEAKKENQNLDEAGMQIAFTNLTAAPAEH